MEEAWLTEFLAIVVEGFGDAVGVEGEEVTGRELAFADFAIPFFENAEDGRGGVAARYGVVAAQKKRGTMAPVQLPNEPGGVGLFGAVNGGAKSPRVSVCGS